MVELQRVERETTELAIKAEEDRAKKNRDKLLFIIS